MIQIRKEKEFQKSEAGERVSVTMEIWEHISSGGLGGQSPRKIFDKTEQI